MREKPWQIFYTVTSNDNGTPGLAILHLAFKISCIESLNPKDLTKESTYEGYFYWDEFEYDKENIIFYVSCI